jgi:sporulation protein YlmC with PRC-barrel domain
MRRLAELIGARVVTEDGRRRGHVKDVRLVQDGPYVEGFGQALRVEGLLVGPPLIGVRLGFERAEVRGPWPVSALFRTLERRATFVPWEDVLEWDGARVLLSRRGGTVE